MKYYLRIFEDSRQYGQGAAEIGFCSSLKINIRSKALVSSTFGGPFFSVKVHHQIVYLLQIIDYRIFKMFISRVHKVFWTNSTLLIFKCGRYRAKLDVSWTTVLRSFFMKSVGIISRKESNNGRLDYQFDIANIVSIIRLVLELFNYICEKFSVCC